MATNPAGRQDTTNTTTSTSSSPSPHRSPSPHDHNHHNNNHNHPTNLSRIESSQSIAEACHIEDINAGCSFHSHPSDGNLNRYRGEGMGSGGGGGGTDVDDIIFEEDEGWGIGEDLSEPMLLEMASNSRRGDRKMKKLPNVEDGDGHDGPGKDDGDVTGGSSAGDGSDTRQEEKEEEMHQEADMDKKKEVGQEEQKQDTEEASSHVEEEDEDKPSSTPPSSSAGVSPAPTTPNRPPHPDVDADTAAPPAPAAAAAPEHDNDSRHHHHHHHPPMDNDNDGHADHNHPGPTQSQANDTATIGGPVPDCIKSASASASPPSPQQDINWAFDDMAELLDHETGPLTREAVTDYAEKQRALAPTPGSQAPPEVTSKPEPESSSEEQVAEDHHERRILEHPLSPVNGHHDDTAHLFGDDEEGNNDDTELFNSIFSQAGVKQPAATHDITPETPAEEKVQEPNNYSYNETIHEQQQDTEHDGIATVETGPTETEHKEQQHHDFAVGEKDTVATTPPTEEEESNPDKHADGGPSFFEESGDYDDGDFFSSNNKPEQAQAQSTSTSTSTAETGLAQATETPVDYGGEAATKATAIAEIFATEDGLSEDADFFANPSQAQQDHPAEAENKAVTTNTTEAQPSAEEIAAKWKAALADDELLDDDFLPDDGEGFLSSDDEGAGSDGKPAEMLRPVMDQHGQLQGFTNVNTAGAPTSTTYSPHTATNVIPQAPHPPSVPAYGAQNSGYQAQPVQYASTQPQVTPSPYAPSQASAYAPTGAYYPANTPTPPRPYGGALKPPPPPTNSRAESFVDKKGGYQSPYDLPMDVIKPVLAKRVSMPHMAQSHSAPPPRQSSAGIGMTPPMAQSAFPPPPVTPGYAHRPISSSGPPATPGAPPAAKPPAAGTPKQAFFEELPIAKTRPTSKYTPQSGPTAHNMARGGSLPGQPPQQQPPRAVSATAAVGTTYQPPPAPALGPAPPLSSRYAPPPAQAKPAYTQPPVQQYAAAPPTPSAPSNYAPSAGPTLPHNIGLASPPQSQPSINRAPTAPYQPVGSENRYPATPGSGLTSSPPSQRQPNTPHNLGDGGIEQHGNQHYSPAQLQHLHSSRPGTAKSNVYNSGIGTLPEEDEAAAEHGGPMAARQDLGASRYGPRSTATPPPPSGPAMKRVGTFSPPTRTSSPGSSSPYTPQYPQRTDSPDNHHPVPPRRARTQSPSTVMNGPNSRTASLYQAQKHVPRPASALAGNTYNGFSPVEQHTRSMSAGVKNFMNDPVNFMPPQDQSVHDPLNRWQGCPIFSWGFGGHVAVMFPTRTQRNSAGALQPMIKCSPGEVKVKNLKEILPLPESFVKFPGPVYSGGKGNKAKKKEVLTWMGEKIESLEHEISDSRIPLVGEVVLSEPEKKRKEEKILLWKGVKTLLENDGVLEGLEIEKSVRQFLWPEAAADATADGFGSINAQQVDNGASPAADRVDAEAMTTIRKHLLSGDRTSAVWHAVDRRLWSHAMLIAGTVSKDLWKQVVQDFVRNEVKTLGGGIESLAVLYEVFAGNGEESIDELVPQSARLGQPMMTSSVSGVVSSKNPLEALERWRETLALIISNRSAGDHSAIVALGKLLASYSRVEAAHLCYLFARGSLVFSGSDDPNANVALFGADHVYSPESYWRDSDALLLSEIYELAVSLSPTATVPPIIAHLQGLKLYHAFTLAENGYRTEAHKYCEAIESVLKTSTKPSPYFHRTLFNTLEDLSTRVSQSPKDAAAGGWLSKPSLDNISGSMWGVFSKFVAGEDNESVASGAESGTSGQAGLDVGSAGYGKMGPSPGISRTQSSADMYGPYSAAGGNGMYSPVPPKTAGGRYEPATPTMAGGMYSPYAPKTPGYEHPNPYEPVQNSARQAYKPTPLQQQSQPSPYTPGAPTPYASHGGYEPSPAQSTYNSPNPYKASFDSPQPNQSTFEDASSSSGYKPPSYDGGYAPPTDDSPYAPPTSGSSPNDDDDDSDDTDSDAQAKKKKKAKPKKKGIMDDDDDDAEFLAKAAAIKKEAEEKKRKEEEEEKKKNAASSGGGGGWFKGWFGKKDPNAPQSGPIKAKLGEESSFVYDPELKRWINKKATQEDPVTGVKGTPPPPKRPGPPSRPGSAAPQSNQPPTTSSSPGPPPAAKSASVPPAAPSSFPPPRSATPVDTPTPSTPVSSTGPPPPPGRVGTPSTPNAPPSRMGTPGLSTPGTPNSTGPPPPSASAPPPGPPAGPPKPPASGGGDILDDLLGGGMGPPRKAGGAAGKKGRKGRYVDVMAQGSG